LEDDPLVLIGPEGRVFDASTEAEACGVARGMTPRAAEVRCPEARLLEADVARCRQEVEAMLQVLEQTGPKVEPHGWGAAYVDLGDLARGQADAVTLCGEIGRAVRGELGQALQPALGWDSSKFTAQAAARGTQPGRLRAVAARQEQGFLRPLPVTLLPLAEDALQRLCFLGLRTLGQYAALSPAAVWQQFGRAGSVAHRCARGKDDRPVVPREQALHLEERIEFETPLVERDRLVAALRYVVSPLLARLRGNLQACGQVRLTVHFDGGGAQERERGFLLPVADQGRIVRALERLLDQLVCRGRLGVGALAVVLGEIQDVVPEQLRLFPMEGEAHEREGERKLQEVQRYLAKRFRISGGSHLRRAVLAQPGAPLPEWRVAWQI
jgi:protein ImuB